MISFNRTPRHPIDRGTSVIVDLPHAADSMARPELCSLVTADTHEQITGVTGMSIHFDGEPDPGNYTLWVVAEQFVDENNEPLKPGTLLTPQFHTEYFRGMLRTALFRYRIAGFTTGSRFDQVSTWHTYVSDAATADVAIETRPSPGLTEFEVNFSNLLNTRVVARHFEYADGFVAFYDADGKRTHAYRTDEVRGVRTIPAKSVLVVDDEQLRILRSALLWDEQRVADCASASDYRAQVRGVLTHVLGMFLPETQDATTNAAACCAPGDESCGCDDADAVEPNERTRQAVARLHEVVERR